MTSLLPPTCAVIHSQETYEGKQGLIYFAGVSAQSVGAQALCLHLLTIPPGGKAHAHLHANHETAIYVLSGDSGMWYGEGLREYLEARTGDFVYIPAGTPHLPINLHQPDACFELIARSDRKEEESVVLVQELDGGANKEQDKAH